MRKYNIKSCVHNSNKHVYAPYVYLASPVARHYCYYHADVIGYNTIDNIVNNANIKGYIIGPTERHVENFYYAYL